MKVTNIKNIGSNKYSILIDNKKHIIYGDVLLELNLLSNKDISEKEYDVLIHKNNYYVFYHKMISFITFKTRCEKEVFDKLKSLNCKEKDALDIINRLKQTGYLNDELYLKSYISDSINIGLKGPNKIVNELNKKGFDNDIINKYLSSYSDEIFKDNALRIINKHLKTNKDSSKMFKVKIGKLLISQGYYTNHFNLDSININDSNNYQKEYDKIYKRLSRKYDGEVLEQKIKQTLYQKGYK